MMQGQGRLRLLAAVNDCARGLRRAAWAALGLNCAPSAPPLSAHRHPSRHAAEFLEPRCLLTGTPLITEFVAINNTGLTDENLEHSDWLELYNPGGGDINLDGY